MRRRLPPLVWLVSVVGMALPVGPAAASGIAGGHRSAPAPQITATPSSVMVNSSTILAGQNFAPRHHYTIKECGVVTWSVPSDPCDTTNVIRATTNRHGGFRLRLTALTCSSPVVPPGFQQVCYVGVPTINGVDTETLSGVAAITVTGP